MNNRILVVDDEADLREQVVRLLQPGRVSHDTVSLIEQIRSRISKTRNVPLLAASRPDYAVDTAVQGQEAFEMVRRSFTRNAPYAMVFLDMRMPPGWDGLETAQRMRGIDKEIEIVMMTAYADYEQREIAERVGEPDKLLYLKKPFHPEEIRQLALAMVEKWNLNHWEKERVIITNRLIRENITLSRRRFRHLGETHQAILDAFISFTDARRGVLALRREVGDYEICAATTPEGSKIISKLPENLKNTRVPYFDESTGTAVLPISTGMGNGIVYLAHKQILFSFQQLAPYLEILLETSRGVLQNSQLTVQQTEGRKLAAIGGAISQIADEVSEAMGVVHKYSQTLRECDDRIERAEVCAMLEKATSDIESMCKDILLFSRGNRELQRYSDHKLVELVNEVVAAPTRETRGKADVVLDIPEEMMLACVSRSIRRAFGNLVDNALEALAAKKGDGERCLTIRAQYCGTGNREIQISFCDNGVGLPEDMTQQMLEPFFTHGKYTRRGLGATVARQIIEEHCGRILPVRSRQGEGTDVTVILPVAPPKS